MINDLLDKTLTLERGDHATGAAAGRKPVWSPILAGVRCALWPASSRTLREFQGDEMEVDHEIVTEVDIAAKRSDRVVIKGVIYAVAAYRSYDNAHFGDALFVVVASKRG